MIYIRRISNSIRAMVRGGLSPLNRARMQVSRLRSNNVFTQVGQRFRMMQSRLGYYADAPRRYLGISSKGRDGNINTKTDDISAEDGDVTEYNADFHSYELGTNVEQMHKRLRRKQRRATVSIVQHTQIHLVDRMSGQREILHLGFGSGRTKVQHLVNGEPLIFAQSQTQISNSEYAVLISAQSSEVKINGYPVTQPTQLLQGCELNIRGHRYHVDLQASERLTKVAHVHAVWETDTGPTRRENQDALGIYRGDDIYFFAVADGVGSGYSGDRISAYSINYLLSAISLNHKKPVQWDDVLYQAVQNANAEIRNFLFSIQQHGGTTLTALIIDGWTATIAHVGDSRLYLFRNQILQQITEDHSEELAWDDAETVDKAETRSVLSKAIGKANHIDPDLMELRLQPDDRLVLCTDGITGLIADDELSQLLLDVPIQTLPRELINLSNQRNNTDNASVLVIDILDHQTRNTAWEAKSKPRVYTGDSARLIELKKIEKSGLEKKSREQDTASNDEENGLGCSCLVLSLLITILIFAVLWGSGVLYAWLNNVDFSVTQSAEQAIGSSSTPEAVNTATPTSTSTAAISLTINETTEETVIIEVSPSPITVVDITLVTRTPISTASTQILVQIVSATAPAPLEVTSTVRPTNPPR